MALLVNPADPTLAEPQSRAMLSAASKFGLELHVLNASSEDDFDAVFENLLRLRAGGLVISADALFLRGIERLADLTVRHAVPAINQYREFTAAGGLISCGSEHTAWQASIPGGFSRARSPLICRCSRPRRSSCSSTSRPPRRLASLSDCRCPAAQTT